MRTDDVFGPQLLVRRPEARAIRIDDLLAEIRRGRLRVPAFQRGLKWKREDALKLLDSMYRGYPVGTLLLWETSAEADELRFGTTVVAANARPDAWWVVDGQQRVDALARVLLAPNPSGDEFALYFDLDHSKFVSKPITEDSARWLPLAVVVDSEALFRWVFDHTPATDRREKAVQVGKRIREYDIPLYVVYTEDETVLREIFGRVNNTGKQLDAAEVFDALHGTRSPDPPSTIANIARELEALDFGRVEQKILYRLLRVLTGADVTDRAGHGALRLDDQEARTAYADTARAAREVIQFLKRDVGIVHYDLLPYKQPFVTLGKFFHHHPSPIPRSRELLVRWLWRGALNGAHRGDTVSTRRALDQIDGLDEEQSVQRMLTQVETVPTALPSAVGPFNFRHAYGKLQTLALIDLGPRDLETGTLLVQDEIFRRERTDEAPLPAIFGGAVTGGLERTVANRLVHPKRIGLKRLIVSHANEVVLASHAIDSNARDALAEGNATEFFEHRAARLDQHFRQFFDGRARWRDSDRPSLLSLEVAEEN